MSEVQGTGDVGRAHAALRTRADRANVPTREHADPTTRQRTNPVNVYNTRTSANARRSGVELVDDLLRHGTPFAAVGVKVCN
jgi:hypothetical protein